MAATYAFPNHSVEETPTDQIFHFAPDLYPGPVLEIGEFRDHVLVPYPYMNVGCHIHAAASGGPVAIQGVGVVGVNCRFMDPDGPGVVVQIRCLQDAFLDNMILLGEDRERRVTFTELVGAGAVTARHFAINVVPTQNGRLVRLDTMPVVSPGPTLEISVWS